LALNKADDYGQLRWGKPRTSKAPREEDRGDPRATPSARSESSKTNPKKRKGIGEQGSEVEGDEDYEPESEEKPSKKKKAKKIKPRSSKKSNKKQKALLGPKGDAKMPPKKPKSDESDESEDEEERPPIFDIMGSHAERQQGVDWVPGEEVEDEVPGGGDDIEEVEGEVQGEGEAKGEDEDEVEGEGEAEAEVEAEGEVEGDGDEEDVDEDESSKKKNKKKSKKNKRLKKVKGSKRSKKKKADQTQSARRAANEVALARQDEAEEFAEHMQHAALGQTQLQKRFHVTEEERFLLKLKQEHKVRKFDLPIERMYRAPLWLQQRPEDDQYVDQIKEMLSYNRFSHVPDIYVVAVKLTPRGKKMRENTWPLTDDFFSQGGHWEQFQSKDIFLTQAKGLFEDGQVKEDDPIDWPNPKVMAENPNSKHDEIYYLVIGGNHGVAAIKKHIMELPDQKHANLMFRTAQVYINVTPHQIRMLGLESNLSLAMQKKTSFWEQV